MSLRCPVPGASAACSVGPGAGGDLRVSALSLLCFSFSVPDVMNPVYSPGSSGVPYANAKGIGYPGKRTLCHLE